MKRLNKSVSMGIVFSMLLIITTPFQSSATGLIDGATEFTQIMNNIQLVLQELQQEMAYYTQLQQYATQLKNLENGDTSIINGQSVNLRNLQNLTQNALNSGNALYGDLSQAQSLGQQRYNNFAASNLDWQSYFSREKSAALQAKGSADYMSANEVAVMERVNNNYAALQKYADQIPQSQGSQESMTILNGQMNVLTGTMTDLLNFNRAQQQVKDANTLQDAGRQAAKTDAENAVLQQMQGAAQNSLDAAQKMYTGGH